MRNTFTLEFKEFGGYDAMSAAYVITIPTDVAFYGNGHNYEIVLDVKDSAEKEKLLEMMLSVVMHLNNNF